MLRQIFIAISALKISKDFITKYRLWEKWQSMRWMNSVFAVLAIFVGVKMFSLVGTAISNLGHIVTGELDQVQMGFSGSLTNWSFIQSDTYKYFFLFFMMAMVFHIGGRTMEILYGVPYRPTFRLFIRSQIRTTLLLFICYIIEQVATGISTGILSMFGGKWMSGIINFMIESFLFGAVFIDALHEIRGTTVKQGIKHSFDYYPGIALSLGAIGLLMSYVPLIGVIFNALLSVTFLLAIKRVDTVSPVH